MNDTTTTNDGQPTLPIFGTPPEHLHRRDSIDTSVEAAHTVDSATWERTMYAFIEARGPRGATPKDALDAYPDQPYSTITARFAALKRKGLIVDTGIRERRSAVLIASRFAVPPLHNEPNEQWEAA